MYRKEIGQIIAIITYVCVMIILNLNIGPASDPRVDMWGHLGGGITGAIAGFTICEFFDYEARSKNRHPDRFTRKEFRNRCYCCNTWCANWCATTILIVWFIGLFVIFYVVIDVDNAP